MSHVKTAISLDATLFTQAERVAEELKIPRSRLFMMAIRDYLDQYEANKMLDQLNEVYADEAIQAETREITSRMRPHQRKLVEGTW